ncbi:hypothetical protein OESDEN_17121 [Oesophagostomum dentatum]|uniref:Uncharacterized protein n=1 Tax=Oesophagostomum dentatum TaxID=61180 RepID=A0A0B1SI57_OESDE|nr:hypothetical protein OESDEN_17121 [Oesophagostomum dentatum]
MALFGRRMKRTAIRWHASYGAFAEKAPWPKYIPIGGVDCKR